MSKLYYTCDPEKDTECVKTRCQTTCFITDNIKFSVDNRALWPFRLAGQPVCKSCPLDCATCGKPCERFDTFTDYVNHDIGYIQKDEVPA